MNENGGKKRREWVKNAAIIFLSVMLVLTFFQHIYELFPSGGGGTICTVRHHHGEDPRNRHGGEWRSL